MQDRFALCWPHRRRQGFHCPATVQSQVPLQPAEYLRRRLDGHHLAAGRDKLGGKDAVKTMVGTDVQAMHPGLQVAAEELQLTNVPPIEIEIEGTFLRIHERHHLAPTKAEHSPAVGAQGIADRKDRQLR